MRGVAGHHAHLHAALQVAVVDAHQDHDAEIGVVPAVHEKRLERLFGLALRRRQALDQGLQHLDDAGTGLRRNGQGVGAVDADDVGDLFADALRLGGRQVDLVEHRHDLVVGVDGQVGVGQGLRLHPLGGVDHQQRALAGGQRPAHLVGEVHVPGGVHEVEVIGLAVQRLIGKAHRLRFDGDAAFALDVHGIEHLLLHLARAQPAAHLDQAVGQGRLAVVDVGDDGEVADMRQVGHGRVLAQATASARLLIPRITDSDP